jgi:hypothetical protein
MLIGLINASHSHQILTREGEERRVIRRRCKDFIDKNEGGSVVVTAVNEVQRAITSAINSANSSEPANAGVV